MSVDRVLILIFGVQAAVIIIAYFIAKKVLTNKKECEIAMRFGYNPHWRWGCRDFEDVGKRGEYLVNRTIGESRFGCYTFFDFIIEEGTSSHQIDEIVVNKHGVFVIETKCFTGAIYGLRDQREWKQYKHSEIKTFYNPIMQNKTHVCALKKVLPPNTPIKSLVVFIESDIRKVRADDVISLEELTGKLNSGEEVFSDSQALNVAYKIEKSRSKMSDEQHEQNVKIKHWMLENGVCPNCGGKLVLREGKYGQFYGCTNYPKCKFRKNIDLE